MTATIDTGLSASERSAVASELTKVLADSYAVYLKTHGYHWNVRGPEFFALHNLLEQQLSGLAWGELARRQFRGIARGRIVEHSRIRRKSEDYNGGYAQSA